jgi:hypothetical protein
MPYSESEYLALQRYKHQHLKSELYNLNVNLTA